MLVLAIYDQKDGAAETTTAANVSDANAAAGRSVPIKRRGKQLGARIPDELYDRLAACATQTRIPQARLLERALDAELRSHGF